MQPPVRPNTARVHRSALEELFEQPHRHGFFLALRLLERWFARQQGSAPDEFVARRLRIHNSLSMAFPASEIAEFAVTWRAATQGDAAPVESDLGEAPAPADPEDTVPGGFWDDEFPQPPAPTHLAADVEHIDITPAFIGLLGAGGTLPAFYTELFAERENYHRDRAGRAFLDIFLQRAAVLLYRAWLKHRLPLQFEADRRRRFLPLVLALAGLGQDGLRDRLQPRRGGVADDSLAHFAGLIQQRPRSAAAVQAIVQRYFGVPVRLTEFIGRWVTLPAEHQSRLGLAHGTLCSDAMVGERVWQRDLRVRLELGPMDLRRFSRFLPGGPGALALRELLTMLTGVALEYEIRLVLRAADVQPARIGATGAPRLGWDSFLVTQPAATDRSDAGYDLHATA